MEEGKIRRRKACLPCRQSKRKCDGEKPCSRCIRSAGKMCVYKEEKSLTSLRPQKLQTDLFDLVTRRKYVQSYFEGINPIVMFNRVGSSVDTYDHPTTKSQQLQINAILASSTRAFGAPRNVYRGFERKACKIAAELISDFSYPTALGFNYLSYFFWGQDEVKAAHYRNIALSLCRCSLRSPHNQYDKENLIKLQIGTLAIQKTAQNNPKRTVEVLVPEDLLNQTNTNSMSMLEVADWVIIHAKAEKLFLFGDQEKADVTMDVSEFNENYSLLMKVCEKLPQTSNPTPIVQLVGIMKGFLAALFSHAAGLPQDSLRNIEESLKVLEANDYLIGMGGAQFIVVLHSVFMVSIQLQNISLATRVNNVQKKQAEIFISAQELMEKDKDVLEKSLCVGYSDSFQPAKSFSCTVNPESASPFNWMSNVPLPVLSTEPQTTKPTTTL